MTTAVLGLGTAVPRHYVQREESLAFALSCFAQNEDDGRRIKLLYRKAGVDRRHSVVLDSRDGDGVSQTFYEPPNGANRSGPALDKRMMMYEREAPVLAGEACRKAFSQPIVDPGQVTHLVTVSCSGFTAPGVDVRLIKQLGLSPATERIHVGFMGCHGALNGLKAARAIVESQPEAVVLLCAVELCTLHYHYGNQFDQMVANALFADGAAAMVLGGPRSGLAEDCPWKLAATASRLFENSEEAMTWRIRNNGFVMSLSPEVPGLIRDHLRGWLEEWLSSNGLGLEDVKSWAVHPGGPKILASVAQALELGDEDLAASREILRTRGNMSSPTVLFIMERLRENPTPLPCVALGFGPGLMAEAALFI
jgi:predicted naringenin-chalcone synthase